MNRGPGLRFENEVNAESLIPKARQGKAVKLDIRLITFALGAKGQGECASIQKQTNISYNQFLR